MTQVPSSHPVTSARTRDLVVLLLAMSYPTLMACLYFLILPGLTEGNNPLVKLAFGLGKFIQFGFPLLYVWMWDRQQMRLSRPSWRGLELGLVFGLLVSLAALGLYFFGLKGTILFVKTADKIHDWLGRFNLDNPGGFLAMAGFMSLVHSLLEEYYWRWFVFGRLRGFIPWGWAAVLSGLAFMSHHVVLLGFYLPGRFWSAAVPFSLCVAVGGMVWAWIYQRSGSLIAPWVSHCLVDMAIMVVGYDLLAPRW